MGGKRKCGNYDTFTHFSITDKGFKTPCWIWKGLTDSHGYARGRNFEPHLRMNIHRLFYKHFKGSIPVNYHLDHLCRVRNCVNPDHLEAVTSAVNMQRSNRVKVNAEIVKLIRKGYAEGITIGRLAFTFKVSDSLVSCIVKNRTWKVIEV